LRHFMEGITARGEQPNLAKHLKELDHVAEKEIEKWKRDVPPGSEFAFNHEVSEIKQALQIFLTEEEGRCKTREPCFFELSFGIPGGSTSSMSCVAPVDIALGATGSFKLRGQIDRIDRCKGHEYEVWDYKTGGSWGYKEEGYLNRGRQLQHALYALAAEILLKRGGQNAARVVRGGYFFFSPKGEGLRIEKSQDRKALFEVLESLFELLRKGIFAATDDASLCRFCPYAGICGDPKVAVARCKTKIGKDGDVNLDAKLDPYRRLMKYA